MISPKKIRKARKDAGLSQEASARLIGISTSMWQSCELGRRKMTDELFESYKSAVMREKVL